MEDKAFKMYYEALSEGEKIHMANKLYKDDGILATKAVAEMEDVVRALDIVEGAAEFWKDEALSLGYKE